MNKTDKNIQKLLREQVENQKTFSELEQNIMRTINTQKDYSEILRKSRRNIKRGVLASLVLLLTFIVTTYLELLISNGHNQSEIKKFFPAIFSGIIAVILYLEMLIGLPLLKKE